MKKIATPNGWKWNVEQLNRIIRDLGVGDYEASVKIIDSVDKFPPAVAGVITLSGGNWWVVSHIDLLGLRLVLDGATALHGFSSETCSISSTGLSAGIAMVSGTETNTMQDISLTSPTGAKAINFVASDPNYALDWKAVNFIGCEEIGLVSGYGNFVMQDSAFLSSAGMRFDGSVGTIALESTFFSQPTGTLITIEPTTNILRRFRIRDSSFVVLAGNTGISFSASATVPSEGYILTNVNFSGGGTYLSGVGYKDNKALHRQCTGVPNSATVMYATLLDNTTPTVITSTEIPVKVLGDFVLNPVTQRFGLTSNKFVYQGTSKLFFEVSSVCALESGNNNVVRNYIALNGVVIPDSMNETTTNAGGRSESLTNRTVVELQTGDELDLWTQNTTNTNNITVMVDSFLVTPIP